MTHQPLRSQLGRYALCVAVLATSFVALPLIALAPTALGLGWPRVIGNALFFWPQSALLLGGVGSRADAVPHTGLPTAVAAAFWLAALVAYVRLTRTWTVRATAAIVLPAAIAATYVVLSGMRLAGFAPIFDGP